MLQGLGTSCRETRVPPEAASTVDGHQAGATQRELAASLIHRRVRRYSAAEWVESKERKRVRRWLAEAVELRDGGYLRLLRGG